MHGSRPLIASLRGVVSSAHPLATQAGLRLLLAGGNAIDAAVAAAAALNVVEPYMSGVAGMGVATLYLASERRIRTLDFIPPVPGTYDATTKTRADLMRGPHSAGTPGNLAGWCELLASHGQRTRAEAFAPAIDLARNGYPITTFNAYVISESMSVCAADEAWSAIYTDGGEAPAPGWVLRQRDLADTLETAAADGPDDLHRGQLARKLVARLQALGGSVSLADLESVQPRWDDPVATAYRGLRVHTPPPQSEGFQMLQSLRLLAGIDVAAMPPNGVEHLDAAFRAIRLAAEQRILHANASRDEIDELLGDAVVASLRARLESGTPISARTQLYGEPTSGIAGSRDHTTSLSVGDAEGNLVCVTQSLGSPFGSGIAVPGTGVVLNNFLNWGELHPDSPNYMAPGAPLSLPIAPSVTTRDGEPVLALGTPGGHGICQTQTQVMLQWADYGLGLQQAIEAPRGVLDDGTAVRIESRVAPATIDELRARGHDIDVLDAFTNYVGGMQGVARDPSTGVLFGGADPRRDGYAAGL
jgi:gamma-glutamyltranspeptidase/glutathione hydrolase